MSKVTLQFELNDDEDRREFDLIAAVLRKRWVSPEHVIRSSDLYSLVWDIDQHLRSREKHGDNVTDEEYKLIDDVRDMISSSGYHEWGEE